MALVGMKAPEKLRGYTKARGLTYALLGELLGTAEQTICQWASGQARPRLKTRYIIQRLTQISPDDWLTQGERDEIEAAQVVITRLRKSAPSQEQSAEERLKGRI